jgi:hypothetical protein
MTKKRRLTRVEKLPSRLERKGYSVVRGPSGATVFKLGGTSAEARLG